jgi:hypothetical protein
MIRVVGSFVGALAALGLIASASAAGATSLLFTYVETGPGAIDVSWDQSSNPKPIAYNYDIYTTVPVSNWTGNVGPDTAVTYYAATNNGGFSAANFAINVYGQQYYNLPESVPAFGPNVWTGVNATDGLPFTLTSIAVPEPAALAMVLAGLGAAGAAMRLARRKARAELLHA